MNSLNMFWCVTLSITFIYNRELMHLVIEDDKYFCKWSNIDKRDTRTDEYCIVWANKQGRVSSALQTVIKFGEITHSKLLHAEACSVIISLEAFWHINFICAFVDSICNTWLQYRNSLFYNKKYAHKLCCEYFCYFYLPVPLNGSIFISAIVVL